MEASSALVDARLSAAGIDAAAASWLGVEGIRTYLAEQRRDR
jgi:hypothetical protein